MTNNIFDPNCFCCDISRNRVPGLIVIELGRFWTLNHYGGAEGFLGWLALQTKFHREDFTQLCDDEANELGVHIREINKALIDYWNENFEDDHIERIYVVYFQESCFDEPTPEKKSHLHIHIIPRTLGFDRLLREKDRHSCSSSTINAWKIYTISRHPDFPSRYNRCDEPNIRKLMGFLISRLNSRETPE